MCLCACVGVASSAFGGCSDFWDISLLLVLVFACVVCSVCVLFNKATGVSFVWNFFLKSNWTRRSSSSIERSRGRRRWIFFPTREGECVGSTNQKKGKEGRKWVGCSKKNKEIRTPSPRASHRKIKLRGNKIKYDTLFPYFSLCKISLAYRTVVKTRVLPTRERKKKNGYARTF